MSTLPPKADTVSRTALDTPEIAPSESERVISLLGVGGFAQARDYRARVGSESRPRG